MKKQIWLTPDQVDLVIECLKFSKQKLCDKHVLSDAHEMAGRFMYRRINEVLAILEEKKEKQGEAA